MDLPRSDAATTSPMSPAPAEPPMGEGIAAEVVSPPEAEGPAKQLLAPSGGGGEAGPSVDDQRDQHGPRRGREPGWFAKDVILGAVIGLLTSLISGLAVYLVQANTEAQWIRDANEREDRRNEADRRLENLRFVRERSSEDPKLPRPFIGLDLQGQTLTGLSLANAQFLDANLRHTNFLWADLTGSRFEGADMSEAVLAHAQLDGANLSGANLSGANLKGVDLSGAYLFGTELSGADLSGANLSGTDLTSICRYRLPPQVDAGVALPPPEVLPIC